jgi:F-type H+-transporting ATPase subunit delta
MITDSVADRYASALFELAKREGRIDETARDLEQLARLIQDHEDLRQFLLNPGVEVPDKLAVLDRLFKGAWSQDVRSFVWVVFSMGRGAYLGEIADAFKAYADVEHKRLRVTVKTAHPLPEALKARLKQRLERSEQRTIELTEEVVPELIGGLQVLLDHRILDGSLKTKLAELRHRLKSVRVH